MNYIIAACLILTIVFTTGCSSSDNNPEPAFGSSFETDPELLGFVSFTDSPLWEEIAIEAEFFRADAQDLKILRKIHGMDLALDSCNYLTDEEIRAFVDKPLKRISAGEKLSLYVENALSLEIGIDSNPGDDDHPYYRAYSEEYSFRLPANSVIAIPGDEFPTMKDIVIPSVEPFTGFNISENGVTIDPNLIKAWNYMPNENTIIGWRAGSVASSVIRITAILFSDPGEDAKISYVNCIAKDDGSFNFPDKAKEFFSDNNGAIVKTVRESLSTHSEGTAGLIVIHNSEPNS